MENVLNIDNAISYLKEKSLYFEKIVSEKSIEK